MDRMLYVAMTGAKQTMFAQSVNSNNLANVSTTGFRADLNKFLSVPITGAGYPSRINTVTQNQETDFTPGTINSTGRELDMAIKGEGWITVQAKDGSEAYTRAGDLRIATGGLLTNGAGHPVMGNGGPIVVPPAEKLEIGVDGTISIRPIGQAATALVTVDRIKLVNPELNLIQKGQDGLMRTRDGLPAAVDANTRLISGALETSNVNVIDVLVKQITLARQFETQIKAMSTVDENAQITTQMMKIN
jgi:flagellar basal-body rod protein FlgF